MRKRKSAHTRAYTLGRFIKPVWLENSSLLEEFARFIISYVLLMWQAFLLLLRFRVEGAAATALKRRHAETNRACILASSAHVAPWSAPNIAQDGVVVPTYFQS